MLMFAQQAGLTVSDPEGEYVSVELRLFAADAQGTPAQLTVSGMRRDFPRVHVGLDVPALAALSGRPDAYGEALGKQLFDGTALGAQLGELRATLDARRVRWRMRLRLDDPSLEPLRWERLCVRENGGWAPIGSIEDRPFSRYVPVTDGNPPAPIVERPVPVLLVSASPASVDSVAVPPITAAERDAIRWGIVESVRGQVQMDELSSYGRVRPTLASLCQALAAGPAIVHVLCHATTGPAGPALVLEQDSGEAHVVDAATLRHTIGAALAPPRLIILSPCESAGASESQALVALASSLVRGGVDAVLVTSDAAVGTAGAFCAAFYERLFAHGVLDRAVNEARAAVRGRLDRSVPILFGRLRDCQLLDFAPAHVDTAYLAISRRVVRAAVAARRVGARDQAAPHLVDAMDALIEELEKSHKVLIGVTSGLRRTGRDPVLFRYLFEAFRYEFKRYYSSESWRSEQTRSHEVAGRMGPAMALFEAAAAQRVLKGEELDQVRHDLWRLGDADDDISRHLEDFLDLMDDEVDAITKHLYVGNVAAALARKIAFEDQIGPTFRRSKELLASARG